MAKGVPLYYSDVERIAFSRDLATDEFMRRYCELTVHRLVTEKADLAIPGLYLQTSEGRCIFYKGDGCGIHDVKPYCCRSSPCISLLFQDDSFIEYFKKECKGFGRGPYYSKRKVKQMLEQEAGLEEAEWRLFNEGLFDKVTTVVVGKSSKERR
jgi:Fe-S-cluster containining protein